MLTNIEKKTHTLFNHIFNELKIDYKKFEPEIQKFAVALENRINTQYNLLYKRLEKLELEASCLEKEQS